MKYLQITTILYDPDEIDNWIADRLSEGDLDSLVAGEEVSFKRTPNTTTLIRLIDSQTK